MMDGPAPVTQAREAFELCPDCLGKRLCWRCNGAGVGEGLACKECFGRGRCSGCDGAGETATRRVG